MTLNQIPRADDIEVRAGDDLAIGIHLAEPGSNPPVAADVSDWTFTAQWRSDAAAGAFIAFTVDASSADEGQIVLTMTPTQTRAMGDSGAWDLQGVRAGKTRTFLEGWTVWREDVTRG